MVALSRRALARLAFSASAAQLADRARAQVSTSDDSWLRPGELVDQARSLLVAAHELFEKAIIFERERGTSWAELGAVLDISKQAAQQRHGQAVEDWAQSLDQALTVVEGQFAFAHVPGEGGAAPGELAERLDAWCLQFTGRHNKPGGTKPVSGGLELAGSAEQVLLLNRLAQRMTTERDPAKLRAFHAAKTALMAALLEGTPENGEARPAPARSQPGVLSLSDARKKPRKPRA